MRMRTLKLLSISLLLAGALSCSPKASPPTSLQGTTLPEFSQHGHAVYAAEGHSELLTIDDYVAVDPADSLLKGCSGGAFSVDWHGTKNNAAAYWNPGVDGAEIHWLTRKSDMGGWNAYRSLITSTNPMYPPWGKFFSIDYVPQPGGDGPEYAYQVLPNQTDLQRVWINGETVKRTGYAQWYVDGQSWHAGCMDGDPAFKYLPPWSNTPAVAWTVVYSTTNVSTPRYSGKALAVEEYEGCDPANLTGCAHEVSYYAPGIGEVENVSIWQNSTIVRVQ